MDYTILILALPMLSFLLLALAGMKMPHRVAGAIGTLSLGVVAVLSYLTAFSYFTAPRTAEGLYPTLTPWNIEWLPFTSSLHIDMGILLDPISVMMLVVISTVSLMVHIYSFGYMKGEVGFQRYYAFLSLFTFSMCWDWSLQPISSRCMCSGSWWVCLLTCSSVSITPNRKPLPPARKRLS